MSDNVVCQFSTIPSGKLPFSDRAIRLAISHVELQQRRTLLKAGVLSTFGISLPDLLESQKSASAAQYGRAKSCILLYMTGGPAQQETFDVKTEANEGYRGEYEKIVTSASGVEICELLPMLAKNAHRYSIIR